MIMRIAFYDTEDYDRIWFDVVARDEGVEVRYIEAALDMDTVRLADGCDTVSIKSDIDEICSRYGGKSVTDKYDRLDDMLLGRLQELGVVAILIRDDTISRRRRLTLYKDYGIRVFAVPGYSREKLLGKHWVSYLP